MGVPAASQTAVGKLVELGIGVNACNASLVPALWSPACSSPACCRTKRPRRNPSKCAKPKCYSSYTTLGHDSVTDTIIRGASTHIGISTGNIGGTSSRTRIRDITAITTGVIPNIINRTTTTAVTIGRTSTVTVDITKGHRAFTSGRSVSLFTSVP